MQKSPSRSIKWLDRQMGVRGHNLCLCLCEQDYEAVMTNLKICRYDTWILNDRSDATCHFLSVLNDIFVVVCLRVRKHITLPQVVGLLVHEAVHIWQEWCEYYGERIPGQEQEAYAIQSISQNLLEEYMRQTKCRK